MSVIRITNEAVKNAYLNALRTLDKTEARVGWFAKSRYPNTQTKKGKSIPGLPVATVAAIQEKGYPAMNIPARPTMQPTADAKRKEWAMYTQRGIQDVLKGSRTITSVLDVVGAKAAGDIRKAISILVSPPLKPSTIAARFSKRNKSVPHEIITKRLSGINLTPKESKTLGLLDKPLIDTKLMYSTLTNEVVST